ncbi:19894_t:CDS:2, partial [Gigaspora rosea]
YAKQNGAAKMHTIFYIVKECRIRCAVSLDDKAKSLKTEYKILRLACERSDLSWLYLVEKKIIFLRKIFLLLPTPWEKQHFDVEYDRSCVAGWKIEYNNNSIGYQQCMVLFAKLAMTKKDIDRE